MRANQNRQSAKKQSGQTLIETIVAIFLLTTALSGGLALTIFALNSSQNNFNQIIATNLAREGIDAVRMMRDSNWMEGDKKAVAPWDLQPCDDISGRLCYPRAWMGAPGPEGHSYDIRPNTYRAEYTVATKQWSPLAVNASYNLYLQSDGSYTHTVNGTSIFARKIVTSYDTASPYAATDTNSNTGLIIKSIVGWRGKGCTAMTGEDPETTNCKVVVEEHLSNWKDYK